MNLHSVTCAVACTAAGGILLSAALLAAQDRPRLQRVAPASLAELRSEDARVEQMRRGGELRLRDVREDTLVRGGRIERADQYHRGVRVFGAGVTRQVRGGQTISLYGTLHEAIGIDTTPLVTAAEARRRVEERAGVRLGARRTGELVVLPLESGGYALTWRYRAFDGIDLREYFVDARSGLIVFEYSDLQTQAAVGRATGTLGDAKKISVSRGSGMFLTEDALRPPAIRTYDMRGNPFRTLDVMNDVVPLTPADLGSDADNRWSDGALGDAHIYTGYTYDYYFKRFNRRGLDDADMPMITLAHPVRREDHGRFGGFVPIFFANAVYAGDGMMVYGVGLPETITPGGRTWNHTSAAIDIVAHEITHGVTDFTSDLIYRNESGALNESFSDIIGAAVEFMFQPAGSGLRQADYLAGEDAVRPAGIRSFVNPAAYGHPDHYSIRFLGTADNGGVHINSSISNHAFYLAIEGGTNRVSGLTVQGVGGPNRAQIESLFYRAVTQLLAADATFSMARAATIQAARDLYGVDSAAERAMTQAWTAVGVE